MIRKLKVRRLEIIVSNHINCEKVKTIINFIKNVELFVWLTGALDNEYTLGIYNSKSTVAHTVTQTVTTMIIDSATQRLPTPLLESCLSVAHEIVDYFNGYVVFTSLAFAFEIVGWTLRHFLVSTKPPRQTIFDTDMIDEKLFNESNAYIQMNLSC